MNFHILTLFPEMVLQGLSTSIIGRAMEQQKITIEAVDIRDYTKDKHRKVDDYPYGGGAGMLMQAQPVYDAWRGICEHIPSKNSKDHCRTVYVTPQGRTFTQKMAEDFAKEEDLIILCGHYEGIDERVLEEVVTDYVSIGDYVLTGGELAAMVMVDAISRLVPGVLNNGQSAENESFHGSLLEYPQYSRPECWHDKKVPDILLSGNQRKIDAWRQEQAVLRTRERRPDLYEVYQQLQICKEQMMGQKLLHMDMIELINRGRAELLFHEGGEILLRDVVTGICFHTDMQLEGTGRMQLEGTGREQKDEPFETGGWEQARRNEMVLQEQISEKDRKEFHSFVFHQRAAAEQLAAAFGMQITCICYQAVLTRREKLPVTGLYRADGKPMDGGRNPGLQIRPLGMEYAELVAERYHLVDDPAYIRERIAKGQMYGAFLPEKRLVGFIGYHEEGSIGMLEVFPEYQHRHIGQALETYIMNLTLERGWTPYGQIIVGNEGSVALQQSLGLCLSKEQVIWAGKTE